MNQAGEQKKNNEHLGRYLACAFRSFEMRLDRKLQEKDFELTRGPLLVLFCLYKNSPLTQQQLSSILYIDKAAVNRTVRRLEQQEFITRKPSALDRRKVDLYITQKALKCEPEITGMLEEIDSEIRSGLSENEYEMLVYTLKKLHNILGCHNSPGKENTNE